MSSTATLAPDRSARIGVALCLMALFTFACQDSATKVLAQSYAIPQVIMVRFWAFAVFALAYVASRGRLADAARSRRPWLQLFRCLLIVAEMIAFNTGLRYLGLAESHALFAVFPLMATALAVPILGETVGWRRWAGVVAGFVGALIIIRPGLGVFHAAALIPLVAALGFAAYNLLTRLASFSDGFRTSLLYMALVGAVASTAVGLPMWRTPDAEGWMLLGFVSLTGILGHMLLIKALEYAPATLLQPFNYSLLVWASVLGFAVFGEIPDGWTIAGASLIVGAGGYVIWRERQRGAARADVAEPMPALPRAER